MKIDPYNHKEKFLNWKQATQHGIPGISRVNSDIILAYISDMEEGLNVSSKSTKGPRSYIRLNNLRQRIIFLAKNLEQYCHVDLLNVSEEQIIRFFNAMRSGVIRRRDGKCYQSVVDYVKPFKAFWHWHMKIHKKKGIRVADLTEDIDTSHSKPKWVYLSQEQVRQLCDHAKPEYRVLMMFLYDTGIRSPTELINVRVSDIYDDFKTLNIRAEIAKGGSFGRRINLMLCSDLLRQHVHDKGLQPCDQLFKITPCVVNQYLKRLARRVLGETGSLAGEKYSNLTMYDFRHCSCCYWLPRYKSESALKYRFGWKKSDKIHYYSELLGMRDTIREEDMLIDTTTTEIEKRLQKTEQENDILKDRLKAYDDDVAHLMSLMRTYLAKLKQLEETRSSTGDNEGSMRTTSDASNETGAIAA